MGTVGLLFICSDILVDPVFTIGTLVFISIGTSDISLRDYGDKFLDEVLFKI